MYNSRKFNSINFLSFINDSIKRHSDRLLEGRFLLAVSGGADSIAMLYAVNTLASKYSYKLSVVTVDHNLRINSAEDTAFVEKHCALLDIPCVVCRLGKGRVKEVAQHRKKGVEEAARFLRLKVLEAEAEKIKVDFILTAHTRNDALETHLMRFFQGASLESLNGIAEKRGQYLRPLLNIDRSEIIQFLQENNISWREDSSNAETRWLRNRIRHILIPAVLECFVNPYSGVQKTLNQLNIDAQFIANCYSQTKLSNTLLCWEKKSSTCLRCNQAAFLELPLALKIRFLREGLRELAVQKRVPSEILLKLATTIEISLDIWSSGFRLYANEEDLIFSLETKTVNSFQTQTGYLLFVQHCGDYVLPFGICSVYETVDKQIFIKVKNDNSVGIGPFVLPFYIRSRQIGDRFGENSGVSIKKILNDAELTLAQRDIVPIIEERGKISAVYGYVCGIQNYYAKR